MSLSHDVVGALAAGPLRGPELMQRLSISQPTLSHTLAKLPDEVVAMGRGRSRRYAARRSVLGARFPAGVPIYRIEADATVRLLGQMHPIAPAGYWWEDTRKPAKSRRYLEETPWWLADLFPAGYLGRLFARRFAERGLPADPRLWSMDHLIGTLATHSLHDQVGNLVVGETARQRFLEERAGHHLPRFPERSAQRAEDYERLAEQLAAGDPHGSSAAGEQPKFAARYRNGQGRQASFLVKFSPPLESDEGQRWSDLLLAESLALRQLENLDISAAEARYLRGPRRAFLESARFDRTPQGGRRSIMSFISLSMAFTGVAQGWIPATQALIEAEQLPPSVLAVVRRLTAYAILVGNNDRHLGNLSTVHDGGQPRLAPIYDMLPMAYAPSRAQGLRHTPLAAEELQQSLAGICPKLAPDELQRVQQAAVAFWAALAIHPEISAPFRDIARMNGERLAPPLPPPQTKKGPA